MTLPAPVQVGIGADDTAGSSAGRDRPNLKLKAFGVGCVFVGYWIRECVCTLEYCMLLVPVL